MPLTDQQVLDTARLQLQSNALGQKKTDIISQRDAEIKAIEDKAITDKDVVMQTYASQISDLDTAAAKVDGDLKTQIGAIQADAVADVQAQIKG